jgi:hypothetical protein
MHALPEVGRPHRTDSDILREIPSPFRSVLSTQPTFGVPTTSSTASTSSSSSGTTIDLADEDQGIDLA